MFQSLSLHVEQEVLFKVGLMGGGGGCYVALMSNRLMIKWGTLDLLVDVNYVFN